MSLARGAAPSGGWGGGRGPFPSRSAGDGRPLGSPWGALRPFQVAGGTAVATISSLLSEHVSLRVRSVDRIFLAGYVPRLQCDGQLVRFLNERAGGTIPSPAILGKIGAAYVEQINAFANAREIPVVRFTKDMVKEDVARPYMRKAEREERSGVVMLGVAQEKAWAWRGWRDGGRDAHPHFAFAPGRVRQPPLLVHLRSRLGPVVCEDQRVRAVSSVGVPQRPRIRQTPSRAGGDRVHAAG